MWIIDVEGQGENGEQVVDRCSSRLLGAFLSQLSLEYKKLKYRS